MTTDERAERERHAWRRAALQARDDLRDIEDAFARATPPGEDGPNPPIGPGHRFAEWTAPANTMRWIDRLEARHPSNPEPGEGEREAGHTVGGFCERCWGAAFVRAQSDTRKTQTEHYRDLIREHEEATDATDRPPEGKGRKVDALCDACDFRGRIDAGDIDGPCPTCNSHMLIRLPDPAPDDGEVGEPFFDCGACGRDPCRCGVPKHFARAYDDLRERLERESEARRDWSNEAVRWSEKAADLRRQLDEAREKALDLNRTAKGALDGTGMPYKAALKELCGATGELVAIIDATPDTEGEGS